MFKRPIPFFSIILLSFLTISCSKNESGSDSKTDEGSIPKDSTDHVSQRTAITLADPTIFYDTERDQYFLYGTSGSEIVNEGFEVYSSKNLTDWVKEEQLALQKNDTYGTQGFWAPQVFKADNQYYMAYTANEHIAVAKSDQPTGPFTQDSPAPIKDEDFRTIDPFVLIDDDGEKYLYYVRLDGGNRLFSAKMNDDFSDLVPGTATSAINAIDEGQDWENDSDTPITEGPTILKHKGLYYFFYSANHFENPHYAVGYAISENPMGNWIKNKDNPILSKDFIEANGTGHGDIFQDKVGDYYYVFHTHYSKNSVQPRRTAIIKGNFVPHDEGGPDIFKFDFDTFRYLEGMD